MRRRTPLLPVAVGAVSLVATAFAPAANAAEANQAAKPVVLAKDLLSPLSTAIASDGTAYVAQNFAGQIMKVQKGKKPKRVFAVKSEGDEAGAVSTRKGVLTFAVTKASGGAVVMQRSSSGKVTTLADVGKYEAKRNPDAGVTYGVEGIAEDCAAQFPEQGPPPSYTGIVESHPYATAMTKDRVYLADAAANAILAINKSGKVRTLAVLPAVPVEITAELASTHGLPECAVGLTYKFEPVPTDVEVGPKGQLYVSTLPGGPEDGSAGALAKIYRVNPKTGATKVVAANLVSAVGVAVDKAGTVYASQLFASSIVKIKGGNATTFAEVPLPGDVEVVDGTVHATTNVLSGLSGEPGDVPAGQLVKFKR